MKMLVPALGNSLPKNEVPDVRSITKIVAEHFPQQLYSDVVEAALHVSFDDVPFIALVNRDSVSPICRVHPVRTALANFLLLALSGRLFSSPATSFEGIVQIVIR
jgi:hypothetical protein